MSNRANTVSSYGVREQHIAATKLDVAAEELTRLGHTVISSGYSEEDLSIIGRTFDSVHDKYTKLYGADFLKTIDEYNGIRLPLALDKIFVDLAMNKNVLKLIGKLICNKFILSQQNGIINPPGATYNQALWHRDLPYQHFTSSRPLAINALYCVDDFTKDNGASFVLPASHLQEEYPSDSFINGAAKQITARAGSFIVLNCMLFHRGGQNKTSAKRRAVNHLYTTVFIRQQIDIPTALGEQHGLSSDAAELLGFKYKVPGTVAEYLRSRER